MATNKVVMQQLQSNGSYDELYPKTDAWTKDETLSAQVASLLGLRNGYTPDEAFLGLYFGGRTYRYQVTVLYEDGTPAQGITITGLNSVGGLGLITNEKGIALGSSTNKTVTIGIETPYIDQKVPENHVVTSAGVLTKITFQLLNVVETITKTTSFSSKVSPVAKKIDVTTVGGGGGGGTETNSFNSGGGGGGGYVTTVLLKDVSNNTIKATIGAGGVGGNQFNRADRGTTQFFINNELLIESLGGSGGHTSTRGVGNGAGGNGGPRTAGTNSTGYIFNDATLGLAGGGGGGAGASSQDLAGSFPIYGKMGGNPCGGQGGNVTSNSSGTNGVKGSVMGGGGGGSASWYKSGFNNSLAASRASGGVYLRFYF